MAFTTIQPAFASGELAPSIYGRVDISKYHTGCATLRNMFVNYRGGATSRAGFEFIGQCKQNGTAFPPRLISFPINISSEYVLEFGERYVRFIFQAAYVTETPISISSISKANPCVVTLATGSFNQNDWVAISGGMPQLSGVTFIVNNPSGSTFELHDTILDQPVDSTNFDAFTGPATAARIYEIASPWAAVDLPLLKWGHNAENTSLVHPNYPPYDLNFNSPTDWTLTPTQFGEGIAPPTNCFGTPSSPTTTTATEYMYCVTAVDNDTGEESIASNVASITNSVDISVVAGTNTITWDGTTQASNYNVYRAPAAYNAAVPIGSMFGYIGTAFGTQFTDTNITPDFSTPPPLNTDPFAPGAIINAQTITPGSGYAQETTTVTINSSAGSGGSLTPVVVNGGVVAFLVNQGGINYVAGVDTVTISGAGTGATAKLIVGPNTGTYPGVTGFFQQRRVYAQTLNQPNTYWLSKPGSPTNFDVSTPVKADDSISGTPWMAQVDGIQHVVGMPSGLILMTGAGIWQLSGGSLQAPVTPENQVIAPQGYNGVSQIVPPIQINYDILFVQSKGSIVRDAHYNFFVNIYESFDITMLSNHLFVGHSIREWAWAEEPNKIVWAVRDDGALLSLTFVKDQEMAAWARHDTG